MKRKLFLFSCFISMSLTVKPIQILKKSSGKQLYGMYKTLLGSAFAVHGFHYIFSSCQFEVALSVSHLFNNHFPEILDIVVGIHLIYFGGQNIVKKSTDSYYVCIQKQLCEQVARGCAIKLAKFGWNYIKNRTISVAIHSRL